MLPDVMPLLDVALAVLLVVEAFGCWSALQCCLLLMRNPMFDHTLHWNLCLQHSRCLVILNCFVRD